MSFENNLKMGLIILSINIIFYSSFLFSIFLFYKKNKIKFLKISIIFYDIFLISSFLFHISIMLYLIIKMNRDYIFVPIFNILLITYQSINLLHFLKHKTNNAYVTLCINSAIIFFSILNLSVVDDDIMDSQFLHIICVYGILSSIIFNFLTIFTISFKSYIDILLQQDDLYTEIDQINEDCPICLDPLNKDVIKTKCNHHFHKACIVQSLVIKKNCPMCRQNIV